MLAALDAMIGNGMGGRTTRALKQACAIYVRISGDEGDKLAAEVDELMATLAMDLDEASILLLAPEIRRLPGLMPALTSTILSRFHEIEARRRDEADCAPTAARWPTGEIAVRPSVSAEAPPALQACADPPFPTASTPQPRTPRHTESDPNDPVALARRATPEQLVVIAGLPKLPELLTSVLVSRAHGPALVAALENPSARFSAASLVMIAELAACDRALRQALAARADLPHSAADRLFPIVGREARATIALSGSETDIEAARLALVAAEAAGGARTPLHKIGGDLAEGRLSPDAAIAALADDGRGAEIAALAAARLGLAYPTAFAMLHARLDHAAALLARAMGAEAEGCEAVISMRRRLGLAPADGGARVVRDLIDQTEALVLTRLIDQRLAAAEPESGGAERPRLALVG